MTPFPMANGDDMDRLQRELSRLYFPAAPAAEMPACLDFSAGTTRLLALGFKRSADWSSVARIHETLQRELDWPAPALSVGNRDGFTLWFSLAEAIAVDAAQAFLRALCERYRGDLPEVRLAYYPGLSDGRGRLAGLELPPAQCVENDKWSAFIDPTLGSMFVDEAGLDLPPNRERQADLLAGLRSVSAEDFRRAWTKLQASDLAPAASEEGVATPIAAGVPASRLNLCGEFADPKSFLLAVMNDATASAAIRVEAAKALLPYCEVGKA